MKAKSINININDKIEIQLTVLGLKLLCEDQLKYDRTSKEIPSLSGYIYQCQLHEFIRIFGGQMYDSIAIPCLTEIKVFREDE